MITEKYTDFIWDFDGTLFDSYPHTAAALAKTLKNHGVTVDVCEAERLLRVTVGHALRHYCFTEEMKDELYVYEKQDDFPPIIKIYDGAREALERIMRRGGRHFLFTHRDNKAYDLMEKTDVLRLFTDVITVDDGFAMKPAPDAINHLIQKHGLDKNTTVMVGDREIDIGSGINAGVHTLLFDEFKQSPETEAEEIFTDFEQIG